MDFMNFIRPLSAILFCLAAKNISHVKISMFKFALWVIAAYIFSAIAVLISEILGSVVLLVIIFIMLYTNGISIFPSIMITLFTMIIMVICNTVSGIILRQVYSHINYYTAVADDFSLFMSLLVLNYIFSYALSKLLGSVYHKKIKFSQVRHVKPGVLIVFLGITLMAFFYIYVTAVNRRMWHEPYLVAPYIIFFIFLIVLSYFAATSAIKEYELKKNEQELEQLEKYTTNIEMLYNDVRSIRHDYKNVLSSLAGYLNDNDMVGMEEYFKNEIIPFSNRMELTESSLGALSKLKEPSLKGIVAVKLIRAQEDNISLIVDAKEDIEIKGINILDLNRVVGILLDNAHEAALECKNPSIDIGFVKGENVTSIIIVNSINKEKININKIFKQGYSTKGDDRGFGLNNVSKILDKYPNVVLDTQVEKNKFSQVLHIEECEGKDA